MGILLTLVNPVNFLLTRFQDGRLIVDYVEEFLDHTHEVPWNEDTLKIIFWCGLDYHLYQKVPAAATTGSLKRYIKDILWFCGSPYTIEEAAPESCPAETTLPESRPAEMTLTESLKMEPLLYDRGSRSRVSSCQDHPSRASQDGCIHSRASNQDGRHHASVPSLRPKSGNDFRLHPEFKSDSSPRLPEH
ncbi:hypothetical protein PO909_019767 [Leuciscus waleckii]